MYREDEETVIASSSTEITVSVQSSLTFVKTDKEIYFTFEPVSVNFAIENPKEYDYVYMELCDNDDENGPWVYTCGSQNCKAAVSSGTVVLEFKLPGCYIPMLYRGDEETVITSSSTQISVSVESSLTSVKTDKKTYLTFEPVLVTFYI